MYMIAKLFGATWRGLLLFFCAHSMACSSAPTTNRVEAPKQKQEASEEGKGPTSPAVAQPSAKPEPAALAPSVSEVEARLLLNGLFRDAGLRVVNDRRFRRADVELTLDGYDPERGIGYEYIAPGERGTDVSASEVLALQTETQILVVEGGTLDALETAAKAFLARISPGNPEP